MRTQSRRFSNTVSRRRFPLWYPRKASHPHATRKGALEVAPDKQRPWFGRERVVLKPSIRAPVAPFEKTLFPCPCRPWLVRRNIRSAIPEVWRGQEGPYSPARGKTDHEWSSFLSPRQASESSDSLDLGKTKMESKIKSLKKWSPYKWRWTRRVQCKIRKRVARALAEERDWQLGKVKITRWD